MHNNHCALTCDIKSERNKKFGKWCVSSTTSKAYAMLNLSNSRIFLLDSSLLFSFQNRKKIDSRCSNSRLIVRIVDGDKVAFVHGYCPTFCSNLTLNTIIK